MKNSIGLGVLLLAAVFVCSSAAMSRTQSASGTEEQSLSPQNQAEVAVQVALLERGARPKPLWATKDGGTECTRIVSREQCLLNRACRWVKGKCVDE